MHETPELRPLAFGPNLPERFYRGGAGIARFRGIEQAAPNIPEDFIASTTEVFGGGGIGLSALDDGTVLRDAVAANPVGFLGQAHAARFGADPAVLVKMLDTAERLVVHFHPNGSFARRHLGCSHGKNEAWLITEVILDPADDSSGHVFLGFTEDVTDEVVRDWMRRQDKAALLGSLNKVPARPGSTFFVPAGVPHAIGAGITMVEVQEPVDLSILLEWEGFDIDGPNEGHLGLGFDTALTGLTRTAWDSADVAAAMSGRSDDDSPSGVRRLLPPRADEFFRAERVTVGGDVQAVDFEPAFAILVILDGQGELGFGDGHSMTVAAGCTLLVPYGAGSTRVTGQLTALRSQPPAVDEADPAR